MERTTSAEGLHRLLQKHGGLFHTAPVSLTASDEPEIAIRAADMGDVGVLWPEVGKRGSIAGTIRAGGTGLDAEAALIPALAEGLERYSAAVFRNEQFISATAESLGDEALDLDDVPRCSATELAHPKCPLVLPDKTKQIRWVKALSLLDGRIVHVPAVMVYSHVGYAVPEERFWLQISTGCAAHISYEQALLAGICEVIERDAISITWLQNLPLPRIEIDCVPPPLAPYWERYMKASTDLEYLFFDATIDLGIPTIYALQIAQHSSQAITLVACSTGPTIVDGIAKVIRDLGALRPAFRKERPVPDSWDDFTDLFHGATFMAKAESASAFHFLTQTKITRRLSQIQNEQPTNNTLQSILNTLRQKNLSVYAVDLSTDEALRSDMRVVRVVIPELMPLSFRYRARFLGTPRLYLAPLTMGYPSHSEDELNSWPQPFA